MRYAVCSFLLLAGAASAACGYSLAGRGSFLPSYIRIVAIPPIQNRTADAEFEQILTDRIRLAFIDRRRYDVRHDTEGADAVLRGELISITRAVAGQNAQQLASRYLVTVRMRVVFEDLRTNEVIWQNDALTFSEEYDLPGGLDGAPADQQRSSLERIAGDMAPSIVTAIMEAF